MIIFLSWIATALCILGNIFVVKKKNGFLIWFVGTGIMLVLAIMRKDWAQASLFTIYEIINIKGFFEWRKK
jgi:hypothetical protein